MAPFVPRTLEELQQEWPKDLDHISASSLKMANRCPLSEQWRQRYVLGRKYPPNIALVAGSADHRAIEYSMRQRLEKKEVKTPEVLERYEHEFDQRIEEEGGKLAFPDWPTTKVMDKTKREGLTMVGMYHDSFSPYIEPKAVEHEFELQVKDLPVKVVGYIDLLADVHDAIAPAGDEHALTERIIDRKRRGRMIKKPDPEWVVQGEVYQLAKELPHDWHVSVPSSHRILVPDVGEFQALSMKPKPKRIIETQLTHVVAEIGHYYQRYGPDQPWPARGKLHPWACGYCGYRDKCWAWKGE